MVPVIPVEELEKRMHPGAWSQQGFLGADESLLSVMAEDRIALAQNGITATQVAELIEQILIRAKEQRLGGIRRAMKYPNLYQPEAIPQFSLNNLPSLDEGYLIDKFQVFIIQWRGVQGCPWGCSCHAEWASFDFLILNRNTGEFFTGPALIVHLIRHHEFFEGKESPYRVDPLKVLRVFEIV